MAEVTVRGGGKTNVQYVAVVNSVYRRVAMVAAGSATAQEGFLYWYGDVTLETMADARIDKYTNLSRASGSSSSNSKTSAMHVPDHRRPMRLPGLTTPPRDSLGVGSTVWGSPLPATRPAYPEIALRFDAAAAMGQMSDGMVLEQQRILCHRANDQRYGGGVEIEYQHRGQAGAITGRPGAGALPPAEGGPLMDPIVPPPASPRARPPPGAPAQPLAAAIIKYYPTSHMRTVHGERGPREGMGVASMLQWHAPSMLARICTADTLQDAPGRRTSP